MPIEAAKRRHGRRMRLAATGLATGMVLLATTTAARAADRIYWANEGSSNNISFANLDGSGGGGDLDLTGATETNASGLALYPAGGKIFWGNPGFVISFANLDGTGGGGDLNLGGNVASSAQSVASDPGSGRLYWSNSFMSQGIFFARLDNTGGGGQVNTTGPPGRGDRSRRGTDLLVQRLRPEDLLRQPGRQRRG